jgi:hypothetical protein
MILTRPKASDFAMQIDTVDESLGSDLLRGAQAIGQFINESAERVFYLAERGLIPVGKQGGALIASKRR